MKRKWLWPLLLTLLILAIIVGSGIYMAYRSNQAKNTLYVDDYIKNQTVKIDGKVAQHQGTYYLKPGNTQPVKIHVKEGEIVKAGNPLFTYAADNLSEDKELSLKLDNKRVEKEQVEGQIAAYQERLNGASPSESATIQAQINWLESEQTKAENNISIIEEKQKEEEKRTSALTISAGTDGTVIDIDDDQLQSFTANRQDKPVMTLTSETPYFEGYVMRDEVELLAPLMPFKTIDKKLKGELSKVALTPRQSLEGKEKATNKFLIEGKLEETEGLYLGDHLTINVHPSEKDHVWLPKRYVKKQVANKQTQYFVNKLYGGDSTESPVTVEREGQKYYLVTKGLSAIDRLEAYKK